MQCLANAFSHFGPSFIFAKTEKVNLPVKGARYKIDADLVYSTTHTKSVLVALYI